MALACTIHGGLGGTRYSQVPPMSFLKYTIIIDREDKTFRPGERITGRFVVLHAPNGTPDINGLLVKFEGTMFLKDSLKDSKEKSTIVEKKTYFVGDVSRGLKSLGPPKEREYKFDLIIPEDCPGTFSNGKFGWIKYTVKCIANQTTEGMYKFPNGEDVTIISKPVPGWKNHKYLIQPMFGQKQLTSFMLSGKVVLWINTDQKCYSPGDKIRFALKVKNGGGKNIRSMTMQLQQTVIYNFEASKESEKILMPEIAQGPSVPFDHTQVWNSSLEIPSSLQPSVDHYRKVTPISFQYALKVNLQMAGSLIPNMSEEFGFLIANPIGDFCNEMAMHRLSVFDIASAPPDESLLGARRMSIASITPSLPDYDAAIDQMRSRGAPPSYSCLDLNNKEI